MDFKLYWNNMYAWVIVFLLLIAAAASFNFGTFPVNLVVAIAAASVFDLAIKKFWLKKELAFPFSAFITGTIIGSIASRTAPIYVVLLAVLVAIASKHVLRLKDRHVFNPAALGLLIGLALFGLGDEWWAATSFQALGATILLTPLLILPNWRAMKLRVSLSFLLTTSVLFVATGQLGTGNPTDLLTNLFYALPYYFAFIMVSEPKTSPYDFKEQVAFGTGVALLHFAFLQYGVQYYLLTSLLAGNLLYSLYKAFVAKN